MQDFTVEELEFLAQHKPANEQTVDAVYDWDQDFQKEMVSLLMNDRSFVLQAHGLIKPSYFTNEYHKIIISSVFEYWDKYQNLPNRTQLFTEFKDKIKHKTEESKAFAHIEFKSVMDYYVPGIEHRKYYLDKIVGFAKKVALKQAFQRSLEKIKKINNVNEESIWVEINNDLSQALATDRDFDIGLDYFQTAEERYLRRMEKIQNGDYFVTGFKDIDDATGYGGLTTGEIGSIMGLPGTGKSIFLVNAAIANLDRGKKVLYISLEIDQDKCAERFDAQFVNPQPFGEANTGITIKTLHENKEKVFESLRDYVKDKDDSKLLIIKQFPAGQMGLSDLRAYYAQLVLNGFKPDLVIIDYVGEMKEPPGIPIHEYRPRLIRDLRGFATEENICILTAMQPKTTSKENIREWGVLDDDDLAEAKGQNRALDAFWSINQHKEEQECSLARIYVIKTRDGKSRFEICIEFDYGTLKMKQISKTSYTEKLHKHRTLRAVTIEEDNRKNSIASQVDKIVSNKPLFKNDSGYNQTEEYDHLEEPIHDAATE